MIKISELTWFSRKCLRKLINTLIKAPDALSFKEILNEIFQIVSQILSFCNSSYKDKLYYYDHAKDHLANLNLYENLKERLIANGIPVEETDIDISSFENWLKSFPEIRNYYHRYMGDVAIEKCLEHYLAFHHLKINKDDVYIDVAAEESPFADILLNKGIKSYKIDSSYPEGLHNNKIGADAGDTKLPDAFASVMSLHCSYECFMGDADIRFVREASRILNEKGRYGIVPLYLEDTYFIATSPFCNQNYIMIDVGAKRVWRDDGYIEPLTRYYSPEAFYKRVYSVIPGDMIGKVLYFKNIKDVINHYNNQRIYCFFMFICETVEKGLVSAKFPPSHKSLSKVD
jgi:hypothetical protein